MVLVEVEETCSLIRPTSRSKTAPLAKSHCRLSDVQATSLAQTDEQDTQKMSVIVYPTPEPSVCRLEVYDLLFHLLLALHLGLTG